MTTPTGEILTYSENPALLGELVGKARQVASELGWSVSALILKATDDGNAQNAIPAGVDSVYAVTDERLKEFHPDAFTDALCGVLSQVRPQLVLIGATKQGLEIAPRAAERIKAGYAAWVVDFRVQKEPVQVTAKCMLYSGVGAGVYRFHTDTAVLTSAPGVFSPPAPEGKPARVVPVQVSFHPSRLSILGYQARGAGSSRLEEAKAIVDVGQGVKQKEDLAMIEPLVELFGAQLAGSRPVASDRDWFPEWLGLSGKKVSPELCVTIGLSGAVQHIIGIRDSRLIVAVNSDEGAPIFFQADYGVVADLYAFLPAFIERLKARGARPAWS